MPVSNGFNDGQGVKDARRVGRSRRCVESTNCVGQKQCSLRQIAEPLAVRQENVPEIQAMGGGSSGLMLWN
jgi:hypothetical protein